MDFLNSVLGDGLLKIAITVFIVAVAWVLLQAVLRLARRVLFAGCAVILVVGAILALARVLSG